MANYIDKPIEELTHNNGKYNKAHLTIRTNTNLSSEESFSPLERYPQIKDNYLSRLRFLNIEYKWIGNTFAFGFNASNIPHFVIGPHWPLYFVLLIIINSVCLVVYFKLLQYFLTLIPTLIFFTIYIALQITLTINVIINPGILYKEESYNQIGSYCQKCNAFIKEGIVAFHCMMCNVCVENLDHHCVWVGKCIGKQSIKLFYGLIANLVILYTHLIISIIYYYTKIK